MYCPNCGKEIADNAAFCESCGTNVNAPPRPNMQYVIPMKSAGIAAVLSFIFTGLGQIYVGKLTRGLILILGGVGISTVILLTALTGVTVNVDGDMVGYDTVLIAISFAMCLVGIVYWAWQIYDAYKLANEFNDSVQQNNQRPW